MCHRMEGEGSHTYNEDWRRRINPWEVSKDTQVSKVIDSKAP